MGAPSAPTIVQQTVQPTTDEKQAALDAKRQKEAALAKINQDVFARSQGLRGAASMYDWAGPTPHLAGPHVNRPGAPAPPAKPVAPPPVNPWGKGNTTAGPLNDFAHNAFPADQNPGRGPKGDRDPLARTIGGAPINTGAVPGGPAANAQYGGHPQETGLYPGAATAQTPQAYYANTPAGIAAKANLKTLFGNTSPAAPAKPAQTTLLPNQQATIRTNLGLTAQPTGTKSTVPDQPATHVADSNVKPPAVVGPTNPGPGLLALKAAASGQPAPASTPAPPAPATTTAKPPQPLQAPAPVATTKPTTAPAPATTLGGVAKPVVYANPNQKTVAPAPKASLYTTVQHGSGGNR